MYRGNHIKVPEVIPGTGLFLTTEGAEEHRGTPRKARLGVVILSEVKERFRVSWPGLKPVQFPLSIHRPEGRCFHQRQHPCLKL